MKNIFFLIVTEKAIFEKKSFLNDSLIFILINNKSLQNWFQSIEKSFFL